MEMAKIAGKRVKMKRLKQLREEVAEEKQNIIDNEIVEIENTIAIYLRKNAYTTSSVNGRHYVGVKVTDYFEDILIELKEAGYEFDTDKSLKDRIYIYID